MANSQCLLWAFFGKKKSGKKIDTQLSKQLKFENVNKKKFQIEHIIDSIVYVKNLKIESFRGCII